jgi:hypothetical protein
VWMLFSAISIAGGPGDGDLLIETDGNRTGDGKVRAGPRASVVFHSSYASAAQRKGRAGWW